MEEELPVYKRYKLRMEHANGGEHLRDVTLLDWLQYYNVNKFQPLSGMSQRRDGILPMFANLEICSAKSLRSVRI